MPGKCSTTELYFLSYEMLYGTAIGEEGVAIKINIANIK